MDDKQLVGILTTFKDEIIQEFRHQMSIQREDSQHNLDLVVEGHQMLAQKLEEIRTDLKTEVAKVDWRVTAVAVDLAAHRADTEAHHGVYRVKESME